MHHSTSAQTTPKTWYVWWDLVKQTSALSRNYAHWEIPIAQVSITVITVLPFCSGAWVSFPKTLDAARDLGLNGARAQQRGIRMWLGHEHPWEAHPSPQVRHSLAAYFPCKHGIIPKGTTYITVGYETCCRGFFVLCKMKVACLL